MPDNPVSKIASALGSAGRATGVTAQSSEAQGIAAKSKMIDEYKKATSPAPAAKPKAESKPSPTDLVNKGDSSHRVKGQKRIDTKEMTRPLGSFEKGTDNVPEDGVYKLHAGEAVLNEKDAADHRAKKRVCGAMSQGEKSPKKLKARKGVKKTVHHTTVHKSSNGGVILQHEYNDGSTQMEHHPDFQSASDAMSEHYSGSGDDAGAGAQGGGEQENPQMASPSSFAEGGVVEKSGLAKVHKGEVVVPAKHRDKVSRALGIDKAHSEIARAGKAAQSEAVGIDSSANEPANAATAPTKKFAQSLMGMDHQDTVHIPEDQARKVFRNPDIKTGGAFSSPSEQKKSLHITPDVKQQMDQFKQQQRSQARPDPSDWQRVEGQT